MKIPLKIFCLSKTNPNSLVFLFNPKLSIEGNSFEGKMIFHEWLEVGKRSTYRTINSEVTFYGMDLREKKGYK